MSTATIPLARFSPCRTWRYTLDRYTEHEPARAMFEPERRPRTVAFIGLNPSTADETKDDPTIRRCVGFATRWQFERLVMLNVFAYRSTDPRRLADVDDPIGPENDHWIAVEAAAADRVVCAWGAWGKGHHGDGHDVADCLEGINVPLYVLGFTKQGHPRHPLYVRGDTEPQRWKR